LLAARYKPCCFDEWQQIVYLAFSPAMWAYSSYFSSLVCFRQAM
jgi:hypothetical protein